MTTMMGRLRSRLPGAGGAPVVESNHGRFARRLCGVLLAVIIVPLLAVSMASPAFAESCADEDSDEDCSNYSLYQLASNASSYFGEQTSPEGDGLPDEWEPITESAATGGSMLGYADPDFSLFNVVGWMFAEATGSSQTISHDTLKGDDDKYRGMLEYSQFGAANKDLGLDSMSSGIPGKMISAIGGSIIWFCYLMAIIVNLGFGLAVKFLQLINPFQWFYSAVSDTEDSKGSTNSEYQKMLADGMTADSGGSGFLSGIQSFISDWYGLLQGIAWEVMVPLFFGILLISLVLFKKMDKGSAIKKFFVRLTFIGLGLPLVGSMYSAVLDNFDDSLFSQQSGPTRVVLSNYTDFESWLKNDRLKIPDAATIEWEGDAPTATAQSSVRTSSRAINAQSNKAFAGLTVGNGGGSASDAWEDGTGNFDADEDQSEVGTIFATFNLIQRYMTNESISASDFESDVKTDIKNLDVDSDDKEDWFVNKDTYGDVEDFGTEDDPEPEDHPIIATDEREGLSATHSDDVTKFESNGVADGQCKARTTKGHDSTDPADCNLAPLAAYNYLNTDFGDNSLVMYSSNKLGTELVRSDHLSVSQVGTGAAKFMNWSNTGTLLACISLLGFWYAIGMVFGAVKRTFGLVAAIPFATLGALPAIAKVITYTAALILEIIVTLFVYQFVSELLVSVPDIITGPMSNLMANNSLFGSTVLSGVMIVGMTLISTLVIIGVTFAMLKVRKTVLQAIDEAVTKLVDKFLETNSAPKPDKGGMMPAMAGGLGAGAGMAAGHKLAGMAGNKFGGGKTGGDKGQTAQSKASQTNAGGTKADTAVLEGGGDSKALPPGSGGDGGNDGPPNHNDDSNNGSDPGGGGHRNRPAKETAQEVNSNGGLSNLGYGSSESKSEMSGENQTAQGSKSDKGGEATGGRSKSTSFGQDGGKGGQATTRFGTGDGQATPEQSGKSGKFGTGDGQATPGQSKRSGQPGQRSSGGRQAPGTKTAFGTGGPAAPSATGKTPGQRPVTGGSQPSAPKAAGASQKQTSAQPRPSAGQGPAAKPAAGQPQRQAPATGPTPRPAQGQAPQRQAPQRQAPQRQAPQRQAQPLAPRSAPQQSSAPQRQTPQPPAQRSAPQRQAPQQRPVTGPQRQTPSQSSQSSAPETPSTSGPKRNGPATRGWDGDKSDKRKD